MKEDDVKDAQNTIQKEMRELKEFTEAYEKIKASHTKEIELMKKNSVNQREDMTKIKNINLHLTNEVETKNNEIVLLKEEILINRTNFEEETSTADNEKQKIIEDLELKRASLKEKEEIINYLKTELSVKNDNLSSKEIELTEKKSELDKNAKTLEIKEELFKQTEQKYHDLSQSKTELGIKMGNITKKSREAEEMNE